MPFPNLGFQRAVLQRKEAEMCIYRAQPCACTLLRALAHWIPASAPPGRFSLGRGAAQYKQLGLRSQTALG